MTARLMLIALLAAGCGHDVALGGPNTLVRVDPEPSGIHCEEGGVAIQTGLDLDGDAYLDDEEIVSTQYVCNGVSQVECAGGNILEGTVVISETAELAQLAGVNCVDGDLLIAGIDASALALPSLEIVTGDIVVAGNPELTSLDGLASLRNVGRRALVQGNPVLSDLGSLGMLDRAVGLTIIGNDSLTDLRGLEGLTDSRINLNITNNGELVSLAGLENMTSSTEILTIRSNRNLTDASALANLRSVNFVDISGNVALQELRLSSLEKIDLRFIVDNNPALVTFEAPVLATIGDLTSINGNTALGSIALPSLLTAQNVWVRNNTSLTSVSVPSLSFITGNLELTNSPALASTDFGSLLSIGGNLLVSATRLRTFAGFAQVTSVGGTMTVTQNSTLGNFSGLTALERVSGSFIITNNNALTSFAGLDVFSEVGGDLTITGNGSMTRTIAQAFANSITVQGTTTIQ